MLVVGRYIHVLVFFRAVDRADSGDVLKVSYRTDAYPSLVLLHPALTERVFYRSSPCTSMAPPPWTTAEQREFLEPRLEAFCVARSTGSATRFRYELYHQWFQAYPEREVLFPGLEGELTTEQTSALSKAIVQRKKVNL